MAKWYEKIFNWKGGGRKALGSYVGPMRVNGNGQVVWISDNTEKYITDGYAANDVVYSIINMAAEKERQAPWDVYKVKDESSLKLYQAELKKFNGSVESGKGFNLKKCLDLRTKALDLYTGDGKLNELLDWPNEDETFQDLVANSGAAKRLTGNRYLRAVMLEGGANGGKPQEIYLLPSQFIQVLAERSFPARKTGYQLWPNGERVNLTVEEVLHDKTWNPCYDMNGGHLIGMSPLKAALYNLTRNQAAKQASTYSFQNLGPDTIIFIDDDRLSGDEAVMQAKAIKGTLNEEYSGTVNRKKMAVSGYKTGAVNLGLSPVDLAIIEAEKWDTIRFCTIYNFPPHLMDIEHATLDNLKTAEKALTSRCALPSLVSFRNHFNRKLNTDWGYKGKGIYVDFDLSAFPELQPDYKEITTWLKQSPLSIRQQFEVLQFEIPEGYENEPMLDEILVQPNLIPLRELGMDAMNNEMNNIDAQQQDQEDNTD